MRLAAATMRLDSLSALALAIATLLEIDRCMVALLDFAERDADGGSALACSWVSATLASARI